MLQLRLVGEESCHFLGETYLRLNVKERWEFCLKIPFFLRKRKETEAKKWMWVYACSSNS